TDSARLPGALPSDARARGHGGAGAAGGPNQGERWGISPTWELHPSGLRPNARRNLYNKSFDSTLGGAIDSRSCRPLVPPIHMLPVRHRLVHERVQVGVISF